MQNETLIYIYLLLGGVIIALINIRVFFIFQKSKRKILEQEENTKEKLYEIAILKELEQRIGYSLHLEKIIDIVLGSIRQFSHYTAAAYVLKSGSNLVFKCDLNNSVDNDFIQKLKFRMFDSLNEQLNKTLNQNRIEEYLSGAIIVDEINSPFNSYYELPITSKGELFGVLALASIEKNFFKDEEMTLLKKILHQTEEAIRKFEYALEREKGKISSMVESMTDGVLMTDNNSMIVAANPAAKNLIHVQKEINVTIFDFIESFGGVFDIRGKLEESITLRKDLRVDGVIINDKFFQIYISPVRNTLNQEEILGAAIIFHDITKEKEVEKMRDDFTSMMVHDLRTPLDGIKKMISVIDDSSEDIKLREKYLNMIEKEAGEMLNIVNSLLDIAKLESGKFEIFLEEADVKSLIKEKVEYYLPVAKERGVSLSSNVSDNIPESILFDASRVSRVLTNLIGNALKFTDKGGFMKIYAFMHDIKKEITTEIKENNIEWQVSNYEKFKNISENSLIISVTDSGIGIKEEYG